MISNSIDTITWSMNEKKIDRLPKRNRSWKLVHDALGDIFERMRVYRSSRDYFRVTYYGPSSQLRRDCIRILNAIDLIDREDKTEDDGIPVENRWE